MTERRADDARLEGLDDRIDEVRERVEDGGPRDDDEPRFSDDGLYDGPGTDQNAPG